MIISHKHKFIFIKTTKTAGTSIEVFLSQHCGPLDIVTPIIPHVAPHTPRNHDGYFNHISASAVRNKIGANCWDSYFKFCVERNPWDKTLSHFHMQKVRSDSELTFESYIEKKRFPVDFSKYTAPGDPTQIIVDAVLRYERLDEDLGNTFKRLKIPFHGSLGVWAKSEYRTDRRHYREVYTREQAAVVGDAFTQELLLHEYSF